MWYGILLLNFDLNLAKITVSVFFCETEGVHIISSLWEDIPAWVSWCGFRTFGTTSIYVWLEIALGHQNCYSRLFTINCILVSFWYFMVIDEKIQDIRLIIVPLIFQVRASKSLQPMWLISFLTKSNLSVHVVAATAYTLCRCTQNTLPLVLLSWSKHLNLTVELMS